MERALSALHANTTRPVANTIRQRTAAGIARHAVASFSTIVSGRTAMKRLSILAGLAMLALATPTPSEAACNNWDTECLKKEAAQGQQGWPKEMPAECTGYGAANTKPAHCAQWEGWQPGMPPPGQGTPGQGTGTWQPPPGQQKPPPGTGTTWTPDQVMCPQNTVWDQQAQRCLFKKADTPTQTRNATRCVLGENGNTGAA